MGYEGDYIVMPNGCDLPISRFSEDDNNIIRRKHSIPEGLPILIFVGRMMWYKNIKIIVDACSKLKANNFDFRLLMVGTGPDENAIKKYVRKSGLDANIIFTGQILDRSELQLYYSAADLLVFPSVFDTNGLVVREAAASATAALLVDGSCAAEGIKDGETGFLCSENAESVAQSILKIFKNESILTQTGINAQNDIYISWEESIKNAYERYHVVIDDFYSKGKDKEPYKY